MILFLQEWQNLHPNSIIDYNTSNKTFIDLARKYKEMGIKNHAFILSLLNPELQGIDPFSENLTNKHKLMIAYECKINFWYYIREVFRVPSKAGNYKIQFRANRGNIALFWLYWNHVMHFLQQPRQTGKSLSLRALSSHLLNIACVNTEVNYITKDQMLLADNLNDLKETFDLMPDYLNNRNRLDIGNTRELTVNALGNKYKGHLSNQSQKLAEKVGRGFTSPTQILDETPYLSNIEISLPVMLASGIAARELAEINLEPYGTILASTAGKKDDPDGRYVYNLINKWAIWTEHFFDCRDQEHLYEVIRKASSFGELGVYCPFNHNQLGYSDEWMRKVLEETKLVGDAADRDLFGIWTDNSTSENNPLSEDIISRIKKSEIVDYYTEITDQNYIIRWYINENEISDIMSRIKISVGLDTSDAIGRDELTLYFRDIETGSTICCGNYNETNLHTFGIWLAMLMIKYENMILVPERRGSGMAIIDIVVITLLAHGIDPFKRIYNTVVNNVDFKDNNDERVKILNKPLYARPSWVYDKYKSSFGFATSGSGITSRSDLYGISLSNAAKYTADTVKDTVLIKQITGLVNKNGRVDHKSGEHDDLVISWLLSYWFPTTAKNLFYYGIDSNKILSRNDKVRSEISSINTYEYIEQENIRKEMEVIYEKLCKERDIYISKQLEMKLRQLNSRLVLRDNEIFSLEELIDKAKKNSRMNNFYNKR